MIVNKPQAIVAITFQSDPDSIDENTAVGEHAYTLLSSHACS